MYTNSRTALIQNKHLTTKNVYSEVLPGVLRPYDLPDLQRALGDKLVGETLQRRIVALRHQRCQAN